MKIRSKITALAVVILMLLMQVPLAAFATATMTGTLTPDTLSDGKVGQSYSVNFVFTDGTYMSNSWEIEGILPPGLELTENTTSDHPKISGIPTQAGTYTFKMQAKRRIDVNSDITVVFEKNYTVVIDPADPLEIRGESTWYGYENSSSPYAFNHTCEVNSDFDATWRMEAVEGKTLPEELTIDSATGKITWAEPQVGKYQMKVTATCNGESVSKTLKLIVIPYDGCKHTTTTKTTGTPATCKQNGTPDYWYCDACESYFYDAERKRPASENVAELYTTAFHSDKNNDGKCDTEACGKTMPIFKKVTNNDEITSCGMYLVVSKIDDTYYTLKVPEEASVSNFETVEISPNADGNFDYPEADTGVMILKTEFAATCTDLDAGRPRYSFGTNINGVPYCLTGNDYSNDIRMDAYESYDKYGYRINLTESGYAEIASVYSEYWGSGESGKGKGGSSSSGGLFSAYEETDDEITERYFSFATSDTLTAHSVELYKLTYVGATSGGQNYTLSDAQSMVTINNEFTALDDSGSNSLSTAGGISEAVKTSYVESVISDQTDITGNVSVRTYADINLKSGESTVGEWGDTNISSLLYGVTPKIEVKGASSTTTHAQTIADEHLDGSEITLTLCIGNMFQPAQIIHYKTDGTKEYFYNENSEGLKPGQKTFSLDYGEGGNFVTFSVTSFSEIEILAVAKSENGNEISYTDGVLKINVEKSGAYALILANYNQKQLTAVKTLTPELVKGENPITVPDGFTLSNGSKIFLWENLTTLTPLCDAYVVNAD